MDKQTAKLILQSFRPSGVDSEDASFAEALAFASQDKELSCWLANERAQDQAFSDALNQVEIPPNLKEGIYQILNGHDVEISFTEQDKEFASALASIDPPEHLHTHIVHAISLENKPKKKNIIPFSPWVSGLAACFIAAIAFFTIGPTSTTANAEQISSLAEARVDAFKSLNSPLFYHDQKDTQDTKLISWLNENDAPTPKSIPVGLAEMESIGCRKFKLGKGDIPASLICYTSEFGDTIHLIVMHRHHISDEALSSYQVASEECHRCDISNWTYSSWEDDDKAYLVLSKAQPQLLASIF